MTTQSRRPPSAAVDGVLLLDKPAGATSQTAVTRVKRLFNALKAGHTGTLDPMATGLLPVALGEATKFSVGLLEASKGYLATIRFGTTTTTGDLEGEVTAFQPVTMDRDRLEPVLAQFRGAIVQTPPMWSAIKHAGKPLYRYARAGTEVVREPRRITVEKLTLVAVRGTHADVAVECSKGTYVRVLAEDIGKALGCGACLAALRRTRVGAFVVAQAVGLGALEAMDEGERRRSLLPIDSLLAGLPALVLEAHEADRFTNGIAIDSVRAPQGGFVRLYGPEQAFLGFAEALPGGRLQPRRLVSSKPRMVEKTGT